VATAQQISDTRFAINDTDPNHYAFVDSEIGDVFDEQGSVLRSAYFLWQLIANSGDKLQKILQIDITDGYSLDVASRIIERRLAQIEGMIIAEEEPESLYQEDDDRWKWNWKAKIQSMLNP